MSRKAERTKRYKKKDKALEKSQRNGKYTTKHVRIKENEN